MFETDLKMNGSQIFSPQDCTNNNGGAVTPTVKSRIPQPKALRLMSSSGSSKDLMSPKAILSPKDTPLSLSRASSREDFGNWSTAGIHAEKWKAKYQDADRKCKGLLIKSEKTLRENNELERRYQLLNERNEKVEQQLLEKDSQLKMLRTVSEKVYKEYDQLKNQYDVETQAMHKAMQSAGQWYQQNRRLKRRSAALIQRLPPQALQDLDSQDATDAASESSGGEELEGLRETVAELSREVAKLQTEISSVKLQEFEATELNVNLSQELEQEKMSRFEAEERLQNSLEETERNKRLARHLASEVAMFREQLEQSMHQATFMKCEAESAKKERDVLAHRSSIYMEGYPDFSDLIPGQGPQQCRLIPSPLQQDLLAGQESLLKELEALRAEMEQERIKHTKEIDELHEKLLDRETDNEIFILEEKLKLAEEDAKKSIERAEKAEQKLEEIKNNRKSVMNRISMYENAHKSHSTNDSVVMKETKNDIIKEIEPTESISEAKCVPPLAPVPPPPPPPPLPPIVNMNGCGNTNGMSNGKSGKSAIADMANLLGLKQSTSEKKKPSGGAIDEIINQIKGGRFHLKSTEPKVTPVKKQKEEPAALKEMLNILGTLRRRPKSHKESKGLPEDKPS